MARPIAETVQLSGVIQSGLPICMFAKTAKYVPSVFKPVTRVPVCNVGMFINCYAATKVRCMLPSSCILLSGSEASTARF
jgi:hypothetical protein